MTYKSEKTGKKIHGIKWTKFLSSINVSHRIKVPLQVEEYFAFVTVSIIAFFLQQ